MLIKLCTRLHKDLRERHMTEIVRIWKYGPTNARRAFLALDDEVRTLTQTVGNIGRGQSWLELSDGESIARFTLPHTDASDMEAAFYLGITYWVSLVAANNLYPSNEVGY